MSITTLRIMYLNSENLFSPEVPFYDSKYTQEEYDAKIKWIVDLILRADVHVCAFTEIGENANDCLTDILNRINPPNAPPLYSHTFIAQPSSNWPHIHAAIISQFPISNTNSLVEFPPGFSLDLHKPNTDADDHANWIPIPSTEFRRPIAISKISPPNNATPFNLFVVHLKSKRPSLSKHDGQNEAIGIARSAIQRNMEAAALRYYLDTFLPNQFNTDNKVPTILLGDFNDTPNSVPLENIRGEFDRDPGPSSPWTENDKRSLITCARLHLKKVAYDDKLFSYVHNDSFTLIDQALVSKHLVGKFKRMEIYNDHVLRHADMSTPVLPGEKQWKSSVSDHGAVVLEFNRMLNP